MGCVGSIIEPKEESLPLPALPLEDIIGDDDNPLHAVVTNPITSATTVKSSNLMTKQVDFILLLR
jgi:hypothetical protein